MNAKAALRWAAIYRGVAWVFGLVGLALVAAGLYASLGWFPLTRGAVIRAATSPVFVPFALVGFVVWQFGKTVVFYKTLTEAVDEQMAERFDARMVKSEILEVLDDRLAEMDTQLRQTRKQVEEIDAGGATTGAGDSFDFEG